MKYFLCLGGNLGRRTANILEAMTRLSQSGVDIVRASSIYLTEPLDKTDQPWFHNLVAEVETGLDPRSLLALVQRIEDDLGRERVVEKGPRTIDIDIILAGDLVLDSPNLTIPHPRLDQRRFVLAPFLEIAPDVVHPVLKKTIRELARECPDSSMAIRIEKEAA